jgi:hypothetical protein
MKESSSMSAGISNGPVCDCDEVPARNERRSLEKVCMVWEEGLLCGIFMVFGKGLSMFDRPAIEEAGDCAGKELLAFEILLN